LYSEHNVIIPNNPIEVGFACMNQLDNITRGGLCENDKFTIDYAKGELRKTIALLLNLESYNKHFLKHHVKCCHSVISSTAGLIELNEKSIAKMKQELDETNTRLVKTQERLEEMEKKLSYIDCLDKKVTQTRRDIDKLDVRYSEANSEMVSFCRKLRDRLNGLIRWKNNK
jgi:predicted RNase H-like nuclease (RuvC/YqgF family)